MANDIITKPYLKEVLNGVKSYVDSKGGSSVTVDTELSATSENAVANKAVKAALDTKADKTAIPSKVSQLSNDSGFLTKHQDISSLATKTEVDDKLTERLGNIKVKRYKLTDEQIALLPADITLDSYAPQGELEDNTIYILDHTEYDCTYNVISYFVCDGEAIPLTRQIGDTAEYFDGNSPTNFATIKAIMDYVDSKALSGGVTVDSELSDTSENPIANKAVTIALDKKADNMITLAAEPPQNGYESGQINPKYVINCDNFTEVVTPADSKFSKYIYTLYKSEKSTGAMSFIVIKNPALSYLDLKNSTVNVKYVNGKEPVTTSEGYVWVGDIADKTAEAANIILVYNSDGEAMMFTDTYAGVINDSLRLTALDIPTWYGVLKQTTGLEGKIINTEQDGFYIVDGNGNIGAVLSADEDNITGNSGSSSSSLEYAETGTVESINTILI